MMHTFDSQCTVRDDECTACGVSHACECPTCGRHGFHAADCADNDERDHVAHVDAFRFATLIVRHVPPRDLTLAVRKRGEWIDPQGGVFSADDIAELDALVTRREDFDSVTIGKGTRWRRTFDVHVATVEAAS